MSYNRYPSTGGGGGGSGTVTSVNVSGGTTGLTFSGGPVTTSGTITEAGTLNIGHGGTGQVTAAAAINALLPTQSGHTGEFLTTDGSAASWTANGSGDVTGPGSATDKALARFNSTTGKIIQNSVVTVADSTGNMLGVGTLSSGAITSSSLTASTALVSDASKVITSSAVTATELGYVSGVTSAIQTQLNSKQATGNYITALTGDVTAAGPGSVAATIAVGAVTDTKASLAVKPACMVAATTNQALTGTPTIDSQATAVGSLILLTAQTSGAENGPWVAAAGAWARPTWYPSGGTTQAFQFITTFIRLGAMYQGTTWRITSSGAVTIDTTATTWAVAPLALNTSSTTGIGSTVQAWDTDLDALAALSTTGLIARTGSGTVSARTVTGTTNRISVTNGDGVSGNPTADISASYVGQSSITTLGTITTGTWTGTTIALANGGTGQTTKAPAFDALQPMTTAGDIIYGGASGTGTRLAAGSSTQVLHGGTTPSWSAVSLTADVTGILPAANINVNTNVASVGITIDGGGSAITTGVKGDIFVPYGCTINSVTMLADQSGSIVVDIWKVAYASYPATVTNTITASALPTITSATKSQDTTLTGWTTSVSAGDCIRFNVNSATTITRLNLTLKVTKT